MSVEELNQSLSKWVNDYLKTDDEVRSKLKLNGDEFTVEIANLVDKCHELKNKIMQTQELLKKAIIDESEDN